MRLTTLVTPFALLLGASSALAEPFYIPKNAGVKTRASKPSAAEVLAHAQTFLGTRYVWGSCEIPPGLDCSGFMVRVWADMGYALPRVSRQQALVGSLVELQDLAPADLLFFNERPGGPITHVGMYLGHGELIHAATGSGKVTINALSGYFRARFSHARRILQLAPGQVVTNDPLPPPRTETPKQMPSAAEKAEAEAMLKDITLEELDARAPDYDEVRIGNWIVEDADLARQLRDVDTNDPNQFEHAGQTPPPFFVLGQDAFAGAALVRGPEVLPRNEHAVALHAGVGTNGTQWVSYLSPELNLWFERVGLLLNVAFPVPWLSFGGGFPPSAGFQWARPVAAGDPVPWRDYTRALRTARYGERESPLFFSLERHATLQLAEGALIRTLSPSLAAPYLPGGEFGHVPLSAQLGVALEGFSLEGLLDDVLDPHLVGGHVALRPWSLLAQRPHTKALRDLAFSFDYAAHVAPGPATHGLASQVETNAWQSRVHRTDVYVGASFVFPSVQPMALAQGTVGSLWRFQLGATQAHAIRLRSEVFFGKARDTWMDNFEYAGIARPTQAIGTLATASYAFKERFEIGGTYASGHKIEAHLVVHSLPLGTISRLSLQAIYRALILPTSDEHYLFVDAHLAAGRFFRTGATLRKPLGGHDFARWDALFDLSAELPF